MVWRDLHGPKGLIQSRYRGGTEEAPRWARSGSEGRGEGDPRRELPKGVTVVS